jgi:hypothetical protein
MTGRLTKTKTSSLIRYQNGSDGIKLSDSRHPKASNSNIAIPLSRERLESLAAKASSTPIGEKIEDSIQVVKTTLDKAGGNAMLGLHPIIDFVNKSGNSNHSSKKILSAVTGTGLFLTGLINSIKTIFDIITGNNRGQFKIGKLIQNLMITHLGVDALGYSQNKNNALDSTMSIIKRTIPILGFKVFNDILGNPNSASYKITKATGLQSPLSSLTGDLLDNINPKNLLGKEGQKSPFF